MTTALLERAIEAAQRLSAHEKYQLIETIARSLSQVDALAANSAAFLRGHTLDELIDAQQPPIVTDLDALGADFWPEDERADDINDYIESQRRTHPRF